MQKVEVTSKYSDNYQVNEAFKALRTNILFCGSDIKVIVVTSCQPSEGKSSVSAETAIAMAQMGKKVLLIDADLRKSVMAAKYHIGSEVKGLSELLSGLATLEQVLCATTTENLHVIFSGPVPPNPAELLGGKQIQILLENLRDGYDYIIIDSPPLGSVIDSAVVAGFCDGAILVVAADQIKYSFAQGVKEQFEKSGCKILGAVLNRVEMRKSAYAKYYNGHYGRYYGKNGSQYQ